MLNDDDAGPVGGRVIRITLDEALDALNRAHGPEPRTREALTETLSEFQHNSPDEFGLIESFVADQRDPVAAVLTLITESTPGTWADGCPSIPTRII